MSSYSEIAQAGIWIKANSNQSDLIMTQSRPQIVYYSERPVQRGDLDMFANKSYFEEIVEELKPRYLVLSLYEQSPEWIYSYPEKNPNKLTPVQVYYQNQKPIVVIYEFKYTQF